MENIRNLRKHNGGEGMEILRQTEETVLTTVDLVNLINEFRKLEGNRVELLHKSLMAKVRKEVEVLELNGLRGQQNILPSIYENTQGKMQPCYILTKEYAIQLLSGESILVRAKVVEYIKSLEQRVEELEEDIKSLDKVARSDEELAKRTYEADIVKYKWHNIKKMIMDANYKTIEDTVEEILKFHTETLKPKDRARYKTHELSTRTEYKQLVRDRIYRILDEKQNVKFDRLENNVIYEIKENLLKNKLKTVNRSNGRKMFIVEKTSEKITPLDEYVEIPIHGFSANMMYEKQADSKCRKTREYQLWRDEFTRRLPKEAIKFNETVDFSKPIKLSLAFKHKPRHDIDNMIKSAQDALLNSYNGVYKVNDNNVSVNYARRLELCRNNMEGKIYFHLENIKED